MGSGSASPGGPRVAELPPRVRGLVLGSLAVLTVAGALGTAFSPYLLVEQPLLLVALSADNRHVLLAAAQVPPLPLWVVGTVRRMLSLLLTYGLGALYGPAAIRWTAGRFPRVGRLVAWLERLLARWGPALLVPFSSYTLVGLAGVTRMPLRRFLWGAGLGNALYMAAAVWLGEAVARWSALFIAWLAQHLVESTVVCVLAVVVQQLLRRRRRVRGGGLPVPSELAD